MTETKTRFSKSYLFYTLDKELSALESEHGWKRNHVGTAEIERCQSKDKAYALGRYLALTDLFDHMHYEFGS